MALEAPVSGRLRNNEMLENIEGVWNTIFAAASASTRA
jgi:hypothetical protein